MASKSPRKSAKRRPARRARPARPARPRYWLRLLVLCAVLAGSGYVAWLDLTVRTRFEGKRWEVPARIYARPLELYAGMPLTASELEEELSAAGYHAASRLDRSGNYRRDGPQVEVATRAFRFWDGEEPARRIALRFDGRRLASLRSAGRDLDLARLDPALIGRIYPRHHEDRVLVRIDEVPPLLVEALIAVEDRGFQEHFGISPRSVARALWANLRAGATVQGGSTLTQQLAKNFFLTPERSLQRKLNEAILALLLEWHYDKDEILEAYLNEVFLGQDGRRAIHGFGLAAEFYFGRPLAELQLPELALLVALVRGASYYDPRSHPQRARHRRDLVLGLMAERGVITPDEARAAAGRPLGVAREAPRGSTRHPAFLDLVRRQLRRDYRDEDLRSEGLRIFTTLDPRIQRRAEEALARQAPALARGRAARGAGLQGAVVVSAVQNGEVLALVGDREPRAQGFNRALDAVRPIGSLVKPAVYLTALEQPGRYTLASGIDDAPLGVREASGGKAWTPRNYDGRSHGRVPLFEALAHSYNLATVRLGMSVGLDAVARTLHRLGVGREIPRYPSMLLGTLALAPVEVAQMYQTLASGGFRAPLRAIREVTDGAGRPLGRYGLAGQQAVDPAAAFLLIRALEEVARSGTASAVGARFGPETHVAGKTGTTDDLRDSWFAGFTGDRLAVVWLGRDDNGPTGLTGASGALRVWLDLMSGTAVQPLPQDPPRGVEWHWTQLAEAPSVTDEDCPGSVRLPFAAGSAPVYAPCGETAGGGGAPGFLRSLGDGLRRLLGGGEG